MIKKLIEDGPSTLVAMFDRQVAERPQAPAVIFGKDRLSYEELNQKANQLAHYLQELGLKENTAVAVFMDRNIELLPVILAILKAGGAYLPLDPFAPQERLLLLVNESQIPFLITTREKATGFVRYQGRVLLADNTQKLEAQKKDNPKAPIKAQQLAYIIYTSGSTGRPKGVLIKHQSIVNYAQWFADYSGLLPQERIDFSANHAFDLAITTSIIPLTLGLTVVLCEEAVKRDPKLYCAYLETHKIHCVKITPGYFKVLIHQAKFQNLSLHHLKKIILGGENLLAFDCASWLALFPRHILFNEYGPTEASVAVSVYRIDCKKIAGLTGNVPIGKLMPHCKSYLLDEQGKIVAKGQRGELYLSGDCLAAGYLNDEKLTSQSFIQDPFSPDKQARLYKTGDLCRHLPKGELDCLGRIDDQIKIRGFRVEPAEIEHFLLVHPALKSAVVQVALAPNQEKILVAYYILKHQQKPISEKELRQYLQRYLPDFMIPSSFHGLDAFPLTVNEKIDRKALVSIIPFRFKEEQVAASNPLEKTVADIWSNELGLGPLGVHANFFELGGHSLSAARIISTITYVLGKELSLEHFYQNPTIKGLCNLLAKQQKIKRPAAAPHSAKIYKDQGPLPLSDFQFIFWLSSIFEPSVKKLTICDRKRFQGDLDAKKLRQAFRLVLKKHEVLSYQISTFSPIQHSNKKLDFKPQIKSLASLSAPACETALANSFQELTSHHWSKNCVPLIARIFYLAEGKTEIQLGMPHILADEISLGTLFDDLSQFYLAKEPRTLKQDQTYRDYLFTEQAYNQERLDHDLLFWQQYLQDTALFTFPGEYVVRNMRKSKLAYSRYTEMPQATLANLRDYCLGNHISLDNGLAAILLLALRNCCGELNTRSPICINKVKSARDKKLYDNTVGCLLGLEPMKLRLDLEQNLSSLCQQIHTSLITTSPYQKCSNLIKLACLSNFHKTNRVKELALNLLIALYNNFFSSYRLNKKIVQCFSRLSRFKANNFLININVQNNFLKTENGPSPLFGCTSELTPKSEHDLITVDNFLDVCFLRMTDQRPYMVISANLNTDFCHLLSQEILKLCQSIH